MNYESKRWIMLIAGVVINICVGFGYAWSVFQNPLMQQFGWNAIQASLAYTLVMGVSALPMALVGMAQAYISPRALVFAGGLLLGGSVFFSGSIQSLAQLYLVYGIGVGLGVGIVYSGSLSNMVRFFPDKRGFCSGAMAAGMGSGAVIIAPLAAALISNFGVMPSFRIIGTAFIIIICGLSLLIDTAPQDYAPKGWTPKKTTAAFNGADKDWKAMLKDPIFYLMAGIFTTGTTSGVMIIGHASPMFQEIMNFTPQKAAAMLGFLALCNTLGRLFWGWTSDRIGRLKTINFLYAITAFSLLGLIYFTGQYLFVVMVMFIGTCYGGFMSMIASLTADTFGSKNLPINFGIMFLAYGFAAFIGPRMAAVIKIMNNGDYSLAFIIAILMCLAGIVLNLVTVKKLNKERPAPQVQNY
ncbi:L-lactate MFS transporter [Acidaminobacter sp.]|uniref:L-lactate MFS transporter n=1 Tax=Acidaminobacter sp. TaxID=1872102 RepID=UPI002563143F|nr:OFA family MFS transporter [Acidaminobacter sp.]MDK9710519.1 OFA family MFS transporter [Acidaminobacter sp.]